MHVCSGYYFIIVILELWKIGTSIPDSYKGPLHRSDLFMEDSYFLGQPNIGDLMDKLDDQALGKASSSVDVAQQYRIAIKGDSKNGLSGRNDGTGPQDIDNIEGDIVNPWDGRIAQTNLTNSASDVVKAYADNLASHLKETNNVISKPEPPALIELKPKCNETCSVFEPRELLSRHICLFHCATVEEELLKVVSEMLLFGLKTLCHTTQTLYMRFEEFKIHNLKLFQKIMRFADGYINMPLSMNVPLRAALVRLTTQIRSTFKGFEGLNSQFKNLLRVTEAPLDLSGKVLIGAHPGCAMVKIDMPSWKVLEVVFKEPHLIDYVVFQGYALFTAITKYLDEFPTKKKFAAINQGLDMMLGTNCGLYVYGEIGLTPNCDQFGGFPVLDMPIPEFLWTAENQLQCDLVREKIKNTGKPGGAPAPTPHPNDDRKRRKKSLLVGDGKRTRTK